MQSSVTPPARAAELTGPDSEATLAASEPVDSALRLPSSLDLTRADALQGDLLARTGRAAPLVIDGRAVERVSTPCLQLLVAAAAGARAHGLAFELMAASDVLDGAARELGLAAALGLKGA